MAKQRLLFTFSLLLVLNCAAQTEEADTVVYKPKTVTPAIYIDYGKLATIATNFETKYEGGIELLFLEKIQLIAEVGQATLTPEGAFSNGTYESEGTYFRVGAGYLGEFNAKTNIGISARYASSSFSESSRFFTESPSETQDTFVQEIERANLNATWYELVLYTDQRLTDVFRMGVNIRFRILASYDEQTPVDVYAIPGYGRSFDNTIPAANFFIKVTF